MGDKKKILFVFYTLTAGGAEKTVIHVANHLVEMPGYNISFFVYDDSECLSQLVSEKIRLIKAGNSINYHSIQNEYYSKYINFGKSLSSHISVKDYDFIISVHEQIPEFALIYLSLINLFRLNKARFISIVQISPKISKAYHKSFLSRLLKLFLLTFRRLIFESIIAVSEKIKSDIKNYPPHKIKTIFNTIDVKGIKNGALSQVNAGELLKKNQSSYLLNLARITSQKNQSILIEAFNLIKDKITHNLLLMGNNNDRKYFDSIMKMIERLNLKERIIYIGTDANPYPYIHYADAVILSSNYESFSLALHEAMVLKVPVITTKFYGYEEFFNNDNCITAEATAEALAEAMLLVIQKAGKNVTMLENAYNHAMKFDSQKIAGKYHQFFSGYNV